MSDAVVPGSSELTSVMDHLFGLGTDFFSFIAVVAIVAIFAFYFGGDRLIPLIASLYVAIPLYTFFAYKDVVGENPYLLVGLYMALVALSLIAFSGLSYFSGGGAIGFMKLGGLSILTAGLAVAIGVHILPIDKIYSFSAPTLALFSSDQAFFWWLAAPLAGLMLFGRG